MSDKTDIAWTESTWNPFRGTGRNRWMCRKISPGCDHCYASALNKRFGGLAYDRVGIPIDTTDVRLDDKTLLGPLRWKRPRMVFVHSMTDTFGEWVPDAWLDKLWGVMAATEQHTFQILTKRPDRMQKYLADPTAPGRIRRAKLALGQDVYTGRVAGSAQWSGRASLLPLPNVWLGVSVESDRYVWRARTLAEIPAAVRFVSAEPLLEPLPSLSLDGMQWVIVGGESGPTHRPFDPAWARDLRDQCTSAGVAFFFKQHGGRTHAAGGDLLDGERIQEFPVARGLVTT